MSNPKDTRDNPDDAWPFDEVMRSGRAFARAQQKKYQDYLAENDPTLFTKLQEEDARFDVVKHDAIEPVMREVAGEVERRGWHAAVLCDDDHDRLAFLATPSIRLYWRREPFQAPAASDFAFPPSFVAFYGCAQTQTVRTHVELALWDEHAGSQVREASLEYPEVTGDAVRSVLAAVLDDLERS
ncbi:hypothetical protein [uncultured Methylobacterium sp.]|uniref:hypothetical protein n=1 Tax=uncultured Methylobacterium sp. TaxID=157278 RepID=UPI002599EB38|nr:hypothetical protein [uncultured Methylobacterium sp.]